MREHRHSMIFYYFLFLLTAGIFFVTATPQEASAASKTATNARIHFINLDENCDAILLECNGQFGMVDSGEDSSYPNGSNSRYPWRSGITRGHGVEDDVISYLKGLGVERLEFYIGTHPHSDHIGTAYNIIKTFKPRRVYLRPYKDSYITDKTHLWDNLYVYDRAIQAIKEVNKAAKTADEGITLIQTMSPTAKYVDPVRKLQYSSSKLTSSAANKSPTSKAQKGKTTFTLGDGMTIKIMNYNAKLKAPDANYFCLGVKVTANGSTAFLAGDINNYNGTEDRLASQLGHVDILKLGHHGYDGSNSTDYLKTLSPDYAILMGTTNHCPESMFSTLRKMGTKIYVTPLYSSSAPATVVTMKSRVSVKLSNNASLSEQVVAAYSNELARYVLYQNGRTYKKSGWVTAGGRRYYISPSTKKPLTSQWKKIKGKYYYFRSTGTVSTGWFQVNSTWYYADSNGVMQTGWKTINNLKYYFIPSGENAGAMVTGDRKIKGYWYYFRTNGSMFTGWLNNQYYYDEDGHYIKSRNKTGWQKTSSGYWWRNENGSRPKSKWKVISGKRYYFNASGYRVTGLKTINGKKYYFNNKGVLQKSKWKKVNGYLYCFGNDGAAIKGWKKRNGNWYYFNSLCRAVSGSHKLAARNSSKTGYYYFNTSNYTMQTGWIQVSGKWRYYFTSTDVKRLGNVRLGIMARGGTYNVPVLNNTAVLTRYLFDSNGNASIATTPTPEATATPTPEATATPTPEETATPVPEEAVTSETTVTSTPTYSPDITETSASETTGTPASEATDELTGSEIIAVE